MDERWNGSLVAGEVIKLMISKKIMIQGSKVFVLGITYKINCPDIWNSIVIDLVRELKTFGCIVDIRAPLANPSKVKQEYGIDLLTHPS